jgi:TRAP-type C4-dicarboxylate transport system substrate-binding protein
MNPFLMSKRTWDKLSEADRKIITDAAAEATQLQRNLSKEADDKAGSELESKGVKINKVDPAAFAKATESVTTKYTSGPQGDYFKKVVQAAQGK